MLQFALRQIDGWNLVMPLNIKARVCKAPYKSPAWSIPSLKRQPYATLDLYWATRTCRIPLIAFRLIHWKWDQARIFRYKSSFKTIHQQVYRCYCSRPCGLDWIAWRIFGGFCWILCLNLRLIDFRFLSMIDWGPVKCSTGLSTHLCLKYSMTTNRSF
jgi:hypothetical protein